MADYPQQERWSGVSFEPEIPPGWLPALYRYFFACSIVMIIIASMFAVVIGLWYVIYQNFLQDLPFIQEILGRQRPGKVSKEQVAKEIEKIKRQHSQSSTPRRSVSLSRRSSFGVSPTSVPPTSSTRARVASVARRASFPEPFMQPMSVCG